MHPHKLRLICYALVLSMLVACSTDSQMPHLYLQTEESYISRRLNDPQLLEFLKEVNALPKASGWNFNSLYWAAIYFNPSFAEATAQIQVSKAAELTANQVPNPILSITPSRDSTTTPTEKLLGLGINLPIETMGKRAIRTEAAKEQTNSIQWQLLSRAWDIRYTLLGNLADRNASDELIRQTKQLTGTQGELIAEYDERTAQGQIPSASASQAEVNYQQTRLQLEQAKTARRQADLALAATIGITIAALDEITVDNRLPTATLPSIDSRETRKKIIENHPQLRAALADFLSAHQLLKLELAKQVPDLDIGPGYEWDSVKGGRLSLGFSIVLPVFNNNEGPVAEAFARREVAARHFETLQAIVINNMEQARSNRLSFLRELKAAKEIIESEKVKLSRLSTLIKGQNTQIPVLYAKSDVEQAQVNVIAIQQKLTKSTIALEDAIRQPIYGADNSYAHFPKVIPALKGMK